MKKCSKCGKKKKLEAFPVNRTKLDGRGYHCRVCHKKYTDKHYTANKQYYVAKAKISISKIRDLILEAKNKPCQDCGKAYPPWVMDLDHLKDKKFCLGQYRIYGYGKKKIEAELKKCEVVCSNCHRQRTHYRLAP